MVEFKTIKIKIYFWKGKLIVNETSLWEMQRERTEIKYLDRSTVPERVTKMMKERGQLSKEREGK